MIEKNNKDAKPVDFLLLYELSEDAKYLELEQIIGLLVMNGTPLSPAVQKLGYCLGVLTKP